MNEIKPMKVYVVEVCETDCYDKLTLHSIYACEHDAEFRASELRCETLPNDDPCDDGELRYSEVVMYGATVR